MELICLALITVGLITCFGGIYIKKFCSIAMGFTWGSIFSIITIVLLSGSLWATNDEEYLVWIILGAAVFAMFSVIEEKFCAFLNGFMPVFFVVCIIAIFENSSNKDLDFASVVFFASVCAIVPGYIGYRVSDIAHMLETAFTGAFITMLGLCGLVENASGAGELFLWPMRDDGTVGYIFFGTVALGLIGFRVQWKRFKSKKTPKEKTHSDKNWICECGKTNTKEYEFCVKCGKQNGQNEQIENPKNKMF